MALVTRLGKGSPLTAQEMDDNLVYLESSISVGTSGTSGTSGTRGTSGSSGSSGVSGSAGSSGSSGSAGSSGSSGSSGSAGSSGSSGSSGSAGSSGSSGSSGSAGSSGSSGVSGSTGSSGSSGSSGTSISLSVSDGTTFLNGIRSITLTGLGLNISGSGGAEIINYGGGGGITGITVESGSLSIPSVTTLRVDETIRLIDNGGGTTTIGVIGGAGGSSGTSGIDGTAGTSGTSISLTISKDIVSVVGVQNIRLTGSIFVESSGSNGAVLRVDAVSGSGFPFSGSAVITGSLDVNGSITASGYSITTTGTPEIESATDLKLTAGNSVVITASPLRMATFTDAETGSLLSENGDIIYNSTVHKFMGFASGSWVALH